MKRFISVMLTLALLLTFVPAAYAADDIPVYLNGEKIEKGGLIITDRTYLPVRALCEAIGMDVEWDNDTRSVFVGAKPNSAESTGNINIYLDGALMENAEAVIVSDSTYLPVRALCEAIGMDVEWNNDTREVYVTNKTNETLDGKFFRLKHVATGFYLSVEYANLENGAKIVVASDSNNSNQVWGFSSMGDGYFKMYNQNTKKSIDVSAFSTVPGLELTQYTTNGGTNQQVKAILNDDNTYTFTFRHSDLAITASERYTTQEEADFSDTQKFTLEYVGLTPFGQLRESEGYYALDKTTQERFDSYIFTSLPFVSTLQSRVENKLLETDYYNLSKDEQANVLKECLSIVPYDLVYTGEVYAENEKASYEVTNKEYVESFDVWRGTMLPVWKYSVVMEGDVEGQVHEWTMISTVEDSTVVTDAMDAVSRFPYAIRKLLRTVIYREDTANNYNGGGDTIWIRVSHVPSANAIAQTFAHELGHILDTNLTSETDLWNRAKAADMVPMSGYGNNNREEDLAEFSRLYHMVKSLDGGLEELERVYPNRFAAYAALLYAGDSVYFANYKTYYEKAMAFEDDDQPAYYCTVSLPGTSLVLTASDANTKGSVLTFEENTGADNQIWRIRTWQGKKAFFNKASGLCINVPGNSTESGKNLIVWNGGKGGNELITMTETGTDTYSLVFSHSNLYLSGENAQAGSNAIQTSNVSDVVITEVK